MPLSHGFILLLEMVYYWLDIAGRDVMGKLGKRRSDLRNIMIKNWKRILESELYFEIYNYFSVVH
jgi:hypothetical protein